MPFQGWIRKLVEIWELACDLYDSQTRTMPSEERIGELVEISRIGAEELSVEWRIRDVLSLAGGSDDWYKSPDFRIGYEHWFLKIKPNWKRETLNPESGWLRLDLVRWDGGPPLTFHCSVGIRGSGGVEKSSELEKKCTGKYHFYWKSFCSSSELMEHKNRLMPGNILTIMCVLKRIDIQEDSHTRTMPSEEKIGELVEISRIDAEELSVEWRIRDVLSLAGGSDDWYQSPDFRIGYEHWYLEMQPNWKREMLNPESGWLRLDLVRWDGGPPLTFHCSVGIRGSRGVEKSRDVEREFEGFDYYYSWENFCSRSELMEHKTRLMPGNILIITCVLKRHPYVLEVHAPLN